MEPMVGTTWRHSRTGLFVVIVGTARMQDHSTALLFREVGAPEGSDPWVIPERQWQQDIRNEDGDYAPRYVKA